MVEVRRRRFRAMELITILNRCHRFLGFVYQHAHFSADKKSIEVAVRMWLALNEAARRAGCSTSVRPLR